MFVKLSRIVVGIFKTIRAFDESDAEIARSRRKPRKSRGNVPRISVDKGKTCFKVQKEILNIAWKKQIVLSEFHLIFEHEEAPAPAQSPARVLAVQDAVEQRRLPASEEPGDDVHLGPK